MANFEDLDFTELERRGGFASEQTLAELLQAFKMMDGGRGASPQQRAQTQQKLNKSTQQMGQSITRINPILGALEKGFNMLGSAITGASGLVASISSADGSFRSLAPVVDQAAEMLSSIFSNVPLIGGFFKSVTVATAELTKLRLTLLDLQVSTFRDLSRVGLDTSTDIQQLQKRVIEANLSMGEFGQIVMSSNDGLRIFGGELDKGVDDFVSRVEALTGTLGAGEPIADQLALLGLSSEQVAQEFADFIETNRFNMRMMSMDAMSLTKAMTERLKNERIIAELTGQSADEQRQAQMALATDAAFQAAISGMANADELTTFVAGLSGPVRDAAKQLIAFGTITDEQTAMLTAAAPGLLETLQSSIGGITAGTMDATRGVGEVLDAGRANMDSLTNLTKLGILDGKFVASLGEFFLQVSAINNQLANTEFDSAVDLGESLMTTLEANTTSADTLSGQTGQVLVAARNLEDATANFQARIIELTEGLDTFITKLTGPDGLLDKVIKELDESGILEKAGGGSGNNSITLDGIEYNYGKDEKAMASVMMMKSGLSEIDAIRALIDEGMVTKRQMGGGLFPGMTALVGEAGPELISMGKSFGEVMNSNDTQNLMGNMKSMMDGIMPALQSGDMGSVISQMEGMAPELESSMKTMSGQIQSKVNETGAVDRLESTMNKATSEFQKESMNYAAQNQQTLVKIEKLLKDLLPKAMSGNGYF